MLLTSVGLHARAGGYFEDGYTLLQLCQADQRLEQAMTLREQGHAALDAGKCAGYIEGVIDGLTTEGLLSCIPNIHEGQAEHVVRGFLAAHTELLHEPAPQLVGMALRQVFRCGQR